MFDGIINKTNTFNWQMLVSKYPDHDLIVSTNMPLIDLNAI